LNNTLKNIYKKKEAVLILGQPLFIEGKQLFILQLKISW
jgi:hypothetical protein